MTARSNDGPDIPAETYLAGMATVDITPPIGAPLGGFGARRSHSSTGIYHPLRAVVMSLSDRVNDLIVVSVELLGCYEDFAESIAARITRQLGVPRSSILINASHTHCGPALRQFDLPWLGRIDAGHRQVVIDRIAEAAEIAHHHRYEAVLHHATGHCSVAMNRRRPDPDALPRVHRMMLPNPDGPTDHDLPVITISTVDDGVVRGVIFSYGCHPTARSGLRIGGDFVGFAYDAIEDAFPHAQPMFLQGCGGDQKPRPADPNAESFGIRSLTELEQLGAEVAAAVVAAVPKGAPVRGPVGSVTDSVEMIAEPATAEAIELLMQSTDRAQQRWAVRWKAMLEAEAPVHSEVSLELQAIAIGSSLLLVAMGGELTVEHGLRLKRDHRGEFDQVVPLGYSNTMVGYVPVARQFEEYGYEVLDANRNHGYSGRYLPETEDQIHAAVGGLVARLQAVAQP